MSQEFTSHTPRPELRPTAAAGLHSASAALRAMADSWMQHVLDHLDYGIVLLDADDRTLHVNIAASRLLQRDDPLRVQDGRLDVSARHDDLAWRRALQSARRGLRSLLRLGSPANRLGVAVVPLAERETGAHPATLVVIGRPSICESLSTQWYARRHELTQAEAGVLEMLCEGLRPTDIARRLGIAISTVRTHICSIRSKTGVPTVGALLGEIARLPPLAHALPGAAPAGAWLQ